MCTLIRLRGIDAGTAILFVSASQCSVANSTGNFFQKTEENKNLTREASEENRVHYQSRIGIEQKHQNADNSTTGEDQSRQVEANVRALVAQPAEDETGTHVRDAHDGHEESGGLRAHPETLRALRGIGIGYVVPEAEHDNDETIHGEHRVQEEAEVKHLLQNTTTVSTKSGVFFLLLLLCPPGAILNLPLLFLAVRQPDAVLHVFHIRQGPEQNPADHPQEHNKRLHAQGPLPVYGVDEVLGEEAEDQGPDAGAWHSQPGRHGAFTVEPVLHSDHRGDVHQTVANSCNTLRPLHTKRQRQLMAMFPSILGIMQCQCWVCTNPLLLPMDDTGNIALDQRYATLMLTFGVNGPLGLKVAAHQFWDTPLVCIGPKLLKISQVQETPSFEAVLWRKSNSSFCK